MSGHGREIIIRYCRAVIKTVEEMEKLDGVRDFTNGQKSTALDIISFIEEKEPAKGELMFEWADSYRTRSTQKLTLEEAAGGGEIGCIIALLHAKGILTDDEAIGFVDRRLYRPIA